MIKQWGLLFLRDQEKITMPTTWQNSRVILKEIFLHVYKVILFLFNMFGGRDFAEYITTYSSKKERGENA